MTLKQLFCKHKPTDRKLFIILPDGRPIHKCTNCGKTFTQKRPLTFDEVYEEKFPL